MTEIWELIDIIFSDAIDVILALVVLGVALAAIAWPLVAVFLLSPLSQGKNRKTKSAFAFALIFLGVNLTYSYYVSVPWSYSWNLGWRQTEIRAAKNSFDKDYYNLLTPTSYRGHDCSSEYSTILHHNLIITSTLDRWYMKERMREWADDSDRSIGALIKLLKVILHFPGFVVKIVVFILWSFLLKFYVLLSPYIFLTIAAILAFIDTRKVKPDQPADDPNIDNNGKYLLAASAGCIIPFWLFFYVFPENVHDSTYGQVNNTNGIRNTGQFASFPRTRTKQKIDKKSAGAMIKFSPDVPADARLFIENVAALIIRSDCNSLSSSVDISFQWGPRDPDAWTDVCDKNGLLSLAAVLVSNHCSATYREGDVRLDCGNEEILDFRKKGSQWRWYLYDYKSE